MPKKLKPIENPNKNVTDFIVREILALPKNKKHIIFIDGPVGVGKTTISNSVAHELSKDIQILHVDDFDFPKKNRKQGLDSKTPEKYIENFYHYNHLIKIFLDFKKNNKSRTCYISHRSGLPKKGKRVVFNLKKKILLVEGIFLHRPEILKYADKSIYLDINKKTLEKRRGVRRLVLKKKKLSKKIFDNFEKIYKHYLFLTKPANNSDFYILMDNNN